MQRFKKNSATLVTNYKSACLKFAFRLPRHEVADGGFLDYSSTVIDITV